MWSKSAATGTATVVVGVFIAASAAVYGQGRGANPPLPDGAGRAIVESQCARCHALGLIANSGGYTRSDWEDLFSTMVSLPAEQKSVVADYLAKSFPEQPRPKPVVIDGPVTIAIH